MQPSVLALTDLSGDHQLDLVVASATGNVLIALPNIGGHTVFGTPVELRRLNEPINLLVTNLDADEHGDVIVVQKQGRPSPSGAIPDSVAGHCPTKRYR